MGGTSTSRFLAPLALPGFRMLFFSTLASSFGTLLATVALAIDVKDRTDSGLWVGVLLLVEFVPTVFIGLVLGPLLDRLSRRGLMIAADVVRAGVFCALPFATGPGMIVGLAAVAGLANGFFRPASYAGIPNLVGEERLAEANSLLSAVENISWTVGPLVGGLITAAASPDAAYWVNAATFVVSAFFVLRIPARRLQSDERRTRGHLHDLLDGAAVVRRSAGLMTVLVAWSIASIGLGLANVAEVFLAKDTFNAGDFGYGLLFASIGLGLVIGSLLAPVLDERLGLGRMYATALAVMALGYVLGAVSPNVWVAAVCVVLGGMGNGAATVGNPLFVQRGAPDAMRGRVITLIMSVNFTVLGLSFAAAGPIVDAVGPRWAWVIAASAMALAAVCASVLARRAGTVAARASEAELAA